MDKGSIAILMATYNGERFLREQLDSIIHQTYRNWHLYIHDDGSVDSTPIILSEYATLYPQQITVLEYPSQGDAYHNFMSILKRVDSNYYMFSDQDDIWHFNKIEVTMNGMRALEKNHTNKPLILHTDLRVVDAKGHTIAPSFWKMAGIYPKMFKTFEQRISNVVTGCTMLFNNAAKISALQRFPDGTPLHDEWVTLCACSKKGVVFPISEPLIDYRQHESNTLGAEQCYNRKTLSYYLTNIKKTYLENKANYRILKSAGYGSKMTYLKNKIRNIFVYYFIYNHSS